MNSCRTCRSCGELTVHIDGDNAGDGEGQVIIEGFTCEQHLEMASREGPQGESVEGLSSEGREAADPRPLRCQARRLEGFTGGL